MREKTIEIDGNPFHLRIHGDEGAPPIVFLHGFPEYSGAWDEVAGRLSDKFLCIAPDLRGYGRSWQPDDLSAYRVGPMLADLRGFLDHAGRGAPVNLVAHDWGAALAYVGVAAMPHLVRRFAVLNGVHPVPFQAELSRAGKQAEASQYIDWLRKPGAEDALARDGFALLDRMLTQSVDGAWYSAQRRAAYHAAWGAQPDTMKHMIDWYRASPLVVPKPGHPLPQAALGDAAGLRIPVPHLIVWGEEDDALLPETRDGVRPLCADVTVKTLPNADHWLHHQQPETVARLLRDFFTA